MSYTKTNWENKPSRKTPIDAENLNHMENGIAEAHEQLDNLPQWSKQEEKPKYTYDEVGADEQGVAEKLVDSHNNSKTSHNDIRGNLENLEIYKANSITSEQSSDYIHVTDSTNVKLIDMQLQGKTEQVQYEGKNLFDENKLQGGEFVDFNGVRCYKYIDNANNFTYTDEFKENTQYTVTAMFHRDDNTVGSSNLCFKYTDGSKQVLILNDLDKIYNKTSEKGKTVSEITGSDNYDKAIYLDLSVIQIEEGSTATAYEPYVGGIPSPNPQYPQEIVNAGILNEDTGKYEIECKVFSKNMFLLDKFIEVASGVSGCEIVNFNGRRCLHVINPSNLYSKQEKYNQPFAKGQYTIRFDTYIVAMAEKQAGVGFGIECSENSTLLCLPQNNAPLNQWTTICGTSASNKTCDYLYVLYGSASECYIDLDSIQLEAGAETTAYEPPKQQIFTITSDHPITKWDKLVKRDGVWGWSIYHQRLTIDGSYDWYAYRSKEYRGFTAECLPDKTNRRDGYCNQLRVDTKGIHSKNLENHIWLGVNNTYIYVVGLEFSNSELEDEGLANWKKHLNENPLDIWTYGTSEIAFHPLPDEEQVLLNKLETYYGVTNVYNDQGCPMWIQYVCDTKKYIEQNYTPKSEIEEMKNQIAELQTLVVNNV